MLGPKRSEEPYTPPDLALLQRIARQMAEVREHAELRSRVDDEQRIRREVLDHVADRGVVLFKECPQCGRCYDGDRDRCDDDGSRLTLSLPVERIVNDRYRLDRLIGRGGMGAVYDALDLRLQRSVAVKLLLGRDFGDRDALRRFDREARAVARLNHPNIVAIFDYGTLTTKGAAKGAFLVMERLHGRTLRAVLSEQTTHPPPGSTVWIEQILDAVEAAHAHGIVHRDLKPENVFVATSEDRAQVKVLDFGLATVRAAPGDETASVTMPGVVIGTLAYMAPEQMSGEQVDGRADLFALGVLIVEVLTGRRPFSANPLTRAAEVCRGLTPDVIEDKRLREGLARCLAPNPSERYSTVAEARKTLLPALASKNATAKIEDSKKTQTASHGSTKQNSPRKRENTKP